ncbi:MAG: hypothetical protein ABIO63_04070, partial [Casimicrobiaceae bacterium]
MKALVGRGTPALQILALGAAQCAASNRPLPGAETALIEYHRYFPGKSPDRRATETGLSVGSSIPDATPLNAL